jgi:hypothetical protein
MDLLTKLFILVTSFSLSSQSFSDCDFNKLLERFPIETAINQKSICAGLPPINTEKELKDVLKFFYNDNKLSEKNNRHLTNRNLNRCRPSKDSMVLVIAFEGTGAFEPLIPPTMARLNKCFGGKINSKLINKVYNMTRDIFEKEKGRSSKWSGLQSGIMTELMDIKNSNKVDWYSFPSEEVEQLAGLEELKNFSLPQLYNSIKNSVASNPPGIQSARDCISRYMLIARRDKIAAKVILVSHSSGGRSVIKFAEHIRKDEKVSVDLAFTIDPVIEAHHAIEEVLPQKIGEPLRYAKWKLFNGNGSDYPYSAVWHKNNPSKLYSPSNVKKHLSFYQLDDRLGLKIGGDALRFGIKGSNIKGAKNIHIPNLSIAGHGEISYQDKVLKMFRFELNKYLENQN